MQLTIKLDKNSHLAIGTLVKLVFGQFHLSKIEVLQIAQLLAKAKAKFAQEGICFALQLFA